MYKFEEADYKYCPECECIYPIIFFSKNKIRKDNLVNICKECVSKRDKNRYLENPFYHYYRKKKYREENNFLIYLKNIKYKQNKILNGLCSRCGNKSLYSKTLCYDCVLKQREKNMKNKEEKKWSKMF
jgi:hypothetical protein